jgi:hypothetical protein
MSPSPSSDDLEALVSRLGRVPEPPIPAGLEAKLLAAIPAADALAAPHARRRGWGRRWLVGGPAAAAALLAMVIGSFFHRPSPKEDLPRPQPAPRLATHQPPAPGSARLIDGDAASAPDSFEWPVQLTLPARAQRLPDDLTD